MGTEPPTLGKKLAALDSHRALEVSFRAFHSKVDQKFPLPLPSMHPGRAWCYLGFPDLEQAFEDVMFKGRQAAD